MRGLPVAVIATLALCAPVASGDQRLAVRVTPVMAFAPAFLTIRTTIEPTDDVRRLSVELDSGSYSTVSEIPLEGKHSPRLNVVEIRDVPPGHYEVRATLLGSTGPIAKTVQVVKVQAVAGSR